MNLEIDNLTSDKTSLILIFYESDSTPTDFDDRSTLKRSINSKPDSRILIGDASTNTSTINLIIKYNGDFDFVRNPPGPTDGNSGSKNSVLIAVCIILALLVVVFIGLFAFYWKKRKSRNVRPETVKRSSGQNFMAKISSIFKSAKSPKTGSNPYQTFDKKKILKDEKLKEKKRIFAARLGSDSEMSENSDYFRRNSLPGHLSNDSIDFGAGHNIFTQIPKKSATKLQNLENRIKIDKDQNKQSLKMGNPINEILTENLSENNKQNDHHQATDIVHIDKPLEETETARNTDSFLCYTDEEALKNESEKEQVKQNENDLFEEDLRPENEIFEGKNEGNEFITRSKEVNNEENAPI